MGALLSNPVAILQVGIAFGLLIFVHELGHFIVAKLVGVRVEEFCLGFGPKILSLRRGNTVYGVCWVPLGGYVKMAGQRDFQPDQGSTGAPDEYTSKPPLARAAIIVAGVVMNLIFAYVILIVGFMVGIEFIPPLVGELSTDTGAYRAGLREGDAILSVAGMKTRRFNDVARAIAFRPGDVTVMEVLEGSPAQAAGIRSGDFIREADGEEVGSTQELISAVTAAGARPMEFVFFRGGERLVAEVTPAIVEADGQRAPRIGVGIENTVEVVVRRRGEDGPLTFQVPYLRAPEKRVLGLNGVSYPREPVRIGCELAGEQVFALGAVEGSPAEEAGVKAGDVIVEVNGEKLENARELLVAVAENPTSPVRLVLDRGGEKVEIEMTPRTVEIKGKKVPRIGIDLDARSRFGEVQRGSPAARAGIAEGDVIKSMTIRRDKRVEITWLRGGTEMGPAIVTQLPEGEGPVMLARTELRVATPLSFGASLGQAAREVFSIVRETLVVLYMLVTGRLGMGALSGPLSIVRLTYFATEPGIGYYFWFVALISSNLAVINMLPIPVLDGGHFVFIAAEGLRGRPLNRRFLEYAQVVGLVLILALVIFVTFSDILRW